MTSPGSVCYIQLMKIYNVIGFSIFGFQLLISALLAPPWLGPWWGMAVGFAYLLMSWLLGGLYLSDVIHMGIAHRALDYKEWFIKTVTLINNTVGVYVDPVGWVNRHRLHHRFSDHAGDPNKLASDGFWKTLILRLVPCPVHGQLGDRRHSQDVAVPVWSLIRCSVCSRPFSAADLCGCSFAIGHSPSGCGSAFECLRSGSHGSESIGPTTVGLALGVMTMTDNAMNIGDWLPVMATFSACWQNNDHHYAHLLRPLTIRPNSTSATSRCESWSALGLVKPSKTGTNKPSDVALAEIAL